MADYNVTIGWIGIDYPAAKADIVDADRRGFEIQGESLFPNVKNPL
jgi:hypothetical protein